MIFDLPKDILQSSIPQPNGDSLEFSDLLSLIRVVRAWTHILVQYNIMVIKDRKQLDRQVIVQDVKLRSYGTQQSGSKFPSWDQFSLALEHVTTASDILGPDNPLIKCLGSFINDSITH